MSDLGSFNLVQYTICELCFGGFPMTERGKRVWGGGGGGEGGEERGERERRE